MDENRLATALANSLAAEAMRKPRWKAPTHHPTAYYHCLSRVVDRRFVFFHAEKEHFLSLLRECERFCRVRVLTYCVMSNHFHILVEVPKRPTSLPGPDQILADLRVLSGHQAPEAVRQRFQGFIDARDEDGLHRYLASFHARMFDVSTFMKLLKQRFTQWYNARHGRRGTLWEDRFKSVLVDGAGESLLTMAAYIDLNPVRAGLVRDPKDYRWCAYGEAHTGSVGAKGGIQILVQALLRGRLETPDHSLDLYRMHLYLEGDERRVATGPDGLPERRSLEAREVDAVLASRGRLPMGEYLRCRVRYFCDGAVFGGKEFVEGIFHDHRHRFGPRRTSGARRMRGLAGPPLYTIRDLRLRLIESRSWKASQAAADPIHSGTTKTTSFP